eukprot:scaffold143605_cov53-Attheya_sp.AAC.1
MVDTAGQFRSDAKCIGGSMATNVSNNNVRGGPVHPPTICVTTTFDTNAIISRDIGIVFNENVRTRIWIGPITIDKWTVHRNVTYYDVGGIDGMKDPKCGIDEGDALHEHRGTIPKLNHGRSKKVAWSK